ncbi:hypothetical protein KP509_13G007900 [Ceratopteris richardii]|uniref:Uncharacterized protein n=1 Tax=Ceratopteris richardii TaxID=49495 RepID=A0A8T2TD39_CERRI|nr:hypothetical protein KP509_13G007900 [Ceratopteris richardii]
MATAAFAASDKVFSQHRRHAATPVQLCLSLAQKRSALTFCPLPEALPRPYHHRCRGLHIQASSTSSSNNRNNGFDDLASSLVDAIRSFSQRTGQVIESAWVRTVKYIESEELQGKMQQGFTAANRKIEELTYDLYKGAEDFDRRYRVSERAQEMGDFASQQVKKVNEQLGLAQKLRNFSIQFRRNLPRYRQQLDQFFQTPMGRLVMTIFFMWFLLSGWLFRTILFSMWVLPLAAPLLISSAARNLIVEGSCPSCKRRFIGNRNQIITCNYCRAVVWQPRQDFSRGQSDPTIIDVDID